MLQQVAERLDSVERVGAANVEERFEYAETLRPSSGVTARPPERS
jgi:hypothetical protein